MRFLTLQHLEIEPAALVGDVIMDAGHQLETIYLYRDEAVPESLRGYDGLLVMGGPMSANDSHLSYIHDEIELLKHAIESDVPVLGFCLGSQLLAKAAGAKVIPSPVRELGWHPVFPTKSSTDDPLFCQMGKPWLHVFQWHGETFTLPNDATLLATHPAVPHQAFRLGTTQYGFQFHIEVDEPIIHAWVDAGECERSELGEAGILEIQSATPDHLPNAQRFCREMVNVWLTLCEKRVAGAP